MERELITNTLSDGSVVYDLIIDDTAGSGGMIILHCVDKESAAALFKALDDYTVNF